MEIVSLAISVSALCLAVWNAFIIIKHVKQKKEAEYQQPESLQPLDRVIFGRKRSPQYHDEDWEMKRERK